MMHWYLSFYLNLLHAGPRISTMAWDVMFRVFIRQSIIGGPWMLQPDSFSAIIRWSCARYPNQKVLLSNFHPSVETNLTKHSTSLDSCSFVQMCLRACDKLAILVNIRKHVNELSNVRRQLLDIVHCAWNGLSVIDHHNTHIHSQEKEKRMKKLSKVPIINYC